MGDEGHCIGAALRFKKQMSQVASTRYNSPLFLLHIPLSSLFVAHIHHSWPAPAVSWLRSLGGKLGLKTDLDGLYVLLAGIGSVFAATATLTFASLHSFPFGTFSSGESLRAYHKIA